MIPLHEAKLVVRVVASPAVSPGQIAVRSEVANMDSFLPPALRALTPSVPPAITFVASWQAASYLGSPVEYFGASRWMYSS
jgi:predicted short-subunit dehydrogenase-like oxidoreductase (DUF2520 family)